MSSRAGQVDQQREKDVASFGVKVSARKLLSSDGLNLNSPALVLIRPLTGPMRHPRAGNRAETGERHNTPRLGSVR